MLLKREGHKIFFGIKIHVKSVSYMNRGKLTILFHKNVIDLRDFFILLFKALDQFCPSPLDPLTTIQCVNTEQMTHTWSPLCSAAALDIGFACVLQSLRIYTTVYAVSRLFLSSFAPLDPLLLRSKTKLFNK